MSKKSLIDISIYALVFANLFFLSAVVFSQIILKGETVSVPDLSGKTLPEAKALLDKEGPRPGPAGDRIERRLGSGADRAPGPGARLQDPA